jgi:hypothetical protein
MGFGVWAHHLWAVAPEASWAPRYTGVRARGGSRSLAAPGDKLLIYDRELVAKVIDEKVQLTEVVSP